jgi:NADPH:quinone reductase-like Zn-dependent oxidoreductase
MRRYLSRPNHADLIVLKELVESGGLKPVIERTYALDDAAAALRHIATGHARGKVVLAVAAP